MASDTKINSLLWVGYGVVVALVIGYTVDLVAYKETSTEHSQDKLDKKISVAKDTEQREDKIKKSANAVNDSSADNTSNEQTDSRKSKPIYKDGRILRHSPIVDYNKLLPILLKRVAKENFKGKSLQDLRRLARKNADVKNALMEMLKSGKSKDKIMAMHALLACVDSDYKSAVIQCLKSKDAGVLESALKMFRVSQMKTAESVEPLLELLKSYDDPNGNLVKALTAQGDKRAVGPLLTILEDPEHPITKRHKYFLIEALGHLGNKKSILSLSTLIKDRNPRVQYKATEALGRIARNHPGKLEIIGTENIKAMVSFVEDNRQDMRKLVTGILSHATGQKIRLKANATKDEARYTANQLRNWLTGIGTRGDTELAEEIANVREELKEQLISPDPKTRRTSRRTLVSRSTQIPDSTTVNTLIDSYKQFGADDEKLDIIDTLGQVGDKEQVAIDFLAEVAQNSKDEKEQVAAVVSLSQVDNPTVEKHLINLISGDKIKVEMANIPVIQALSKIKSKNAIKPLLDILRTDKSKLYRATSIALKMISENKEFPTLSPATTNEQAEKIANEWESKLIK